MKPPLRRLAIAALALLPACHYAKSVPEVTPPPRPSAAATPRQAVLFDNLGKFGRRVTTTSADAQRWFDQGLNWLYAFNHDEAARSFGEAARIDPACAMAWWGVALANGPHINNPTLDADHERAAYAAAEKAQAAAGNATPIERDLIGAVRRRYSNPPSPDRGPRDKAYADAMRNVWHANPDDADAGTLFAESMMDLRPWDLWTPDGRPQPGTDEIVAALEAVLVSRPDHPGANHFLVHALEASPHPERALPAADRLRTLVPGAGHLVHMPAHIDLRLGHYADADAANERAVAADDAYFKKSAPPGFYVIYVAHNHQFLSYAAMMEGRSAVAIREARAAIASIPEPFLREAAPAIDGYLAIPYEALVRFGKWQEILAEPEPAADLPICRTILHAARGVALANLGRLDDAVVERAAFELAAGGIAVSAKSGNSPAADVVNVARHMLTGEIAAKRGDAETSFAELREAARIEDTLHYDEPPDWMMHPRHALGALLLAAGKTSDAEAVYRDDLVRHPENVWSLTGLADCLRARGAADLADVEARAKKAAARADVPIRTSCFCTSK
jgi:tetratricopeptide (TPR) repeat protein